MHFTYFLERAEKYLYAGSIDLPTKEKEAVNLETVARVISESKGEYRVVNENGEFRAKVTGKRMFTAASREDFPAVGDWVVITKLNSEQAVIEAILPRQSILKRTLGDRSKINGKKETQIIAANVDIAFIVESVDRDYSLNRFERYCALAQSGNVMPVIILNKIDLLSESEQEQRISEIKKRFENIEIILTSIRSEQGLASLRSYLHPGITCCFLGSSGVGKSSLINKLLGEDFIKTSEVSNASGRGKHTTTSRQMYFLKDGGIVIDNPGIREIGMSASDEDIEEFFDEIKIRAGGCKFADCSHTHEPGCKVMEAVKTEELDADSYSNYLNLKKEAKYFKMSEYEKREKDRSFGRFIKKAKKGLR